MPTSPSIIQRIFENAFNEGDLKVVDELLSPNHLAHSTFGGAPNGPQGLKLLIVLFRTAFPDLLGAIVDEIREGNKAAAHFTKQGTHKGPFLGNPPTGRVIKAQGIIFIHTENGQIVEDWTVLDQIGILQQLRVIPPAARSER